MLLQVMRLTSRRWKGLSPMKLGPFYLREHCVETPWYPKGVLDLMSLRMDFKCYIVQI